jgi:hypothetical protein
MFEWYYLWCCENGSIWTMPCVGASATISGATRLRATLQNPAGLDIPRTRSGKIVELAVSSIVRGQWVINVDALANPEALGLFHDFREFQT